MTKLYTYEAWKDTFKPIINKISKYTEESLIQFETYGEEMEFVRNTDQKFVWTEVDGDEGTYIVAGCLYVNRIQYYITENPWEDEYTEVPTWTYRECDNAVDGECKSDCPECQGEGTVDVDCETAEELRAIYGPEVEVVGE